MSRAAVWVLVLAVGSLLTGCVDHAPELSLANGIRRFDGHVHEGVHQVRRHHRAAKPNQMNAEFAVDVESDASWRAPVSPASRKIEIVVLEDAPDFGAFDFGEAKEIERGFFAQYTRFQSRVKECITGELREYGLDIRELKGTRGLEEYCQRDPNLIGVSYDFNSATRGFCLTPNFKDAILAYCPDVFSSFAIAWNGLATIRSAECFFSRFPCA